LRATGTGVAVWLGARLSVGALLPYTFLAMGSDIEQLRKPETKNVVPIVDSFCFRYHLRTIVAVVVFGVCLKEVSGVKF
jgi:hypothetical protein